MVALCLSACVFGIIISLCVTCFVACFECMPGARACGCARCVYVCPCMPCAITANTATIAIMVGTNKQELGKRPAKRGMIQPLWRESCPPEAAYGPVTRPKPSWTLNLFKQNSSATHLDLGVAQNQTIGGAHRRFWSMLPPGQPILDPGFLSHCNRGAQHGDIYGVCRIF